MLHLYSMQTLGVTNESTRDLVISIHISSVWTPPDEQPCRELCGVSIMLLSTQKTQNKTKITYARTAGESRDT